MTVVEGLQTMVIANRFILRCVDNSISVYDYDYVEGIRPI